MGNIVPFNSESFSVPAYLLDDGDAGTPGINSDVLNAAAFPSISIKGKRFTIARDGVKTTLMKPNDPDEVAQSIGVVALRINMKAKTFYAKKYSEGDSDGVRPDCYSFDGIAPSPNSPDRQSDRCATCRNNVWGSRVNDDGEAKGRLCADNARIAVATPDKLDDPLLLRVPPASLKPLREAIKQINVRKIPYNAVVLKVGFDIEAASPQLTFRPVGLLPESEYLKAKEQYDEETVRGIVGVDDVGEVHDHAGEAAGMDELDAALAAREATQRAKAAAKPASAPATSTRPARSAPIEVDDDDLLGAETAAPAPAPTPAPAASKPATRSRKPAAAAPAPTTEPEPAPSSSILDDLDAILGDE